MSTGRLLFFVLTLIIYFTACKKDILPGNANKRLQKIVSGNADSIFYVSFHYDAGNRMTGYTSTNNTNIGYRWETTLRYDGQGTPVSSQTIRYNDQIRDTLVSGTDSLLYQNNHVVKKLSYYYPNQLYYVADTYGYNSQGNLLVDSSIYWLDNTLWGYTAFTYDANENITQWEYFPKRELTGGYTITATYNSTLNAYRMLGNWVYFSGNFGPADKPVLLSKYNVTKIDYGLLYGSSNTASYKYEYDQDGYINKIIVTGNNFGGQSTWGMTFYYE